MTSSIEAPAEKSNTLALYYAVFVFFLANTIAAMDRTVLSVLVEPIRRELNLTDNQVGALGFAFAVFYGIFGLLLGRLTDTTSRTRLLAVSIGFFSLATMISGAVQNFLQIFLARVAIGVGEAGSVPSKYSLIGDMVRPERRASMLALIQAGLGIGATGGLILAGVLADAVGWRMTFVYFGLPGIVLAALIALTLKEPGRGVFERASEAGAETPSLKTTLRALAANRTFAGIVLAYSATSFAIYGIGYWTPSFLVRTHQMSLTDVGVTYGAVSGAGMLLGLVVSAAIATRLLAIDRRWELWLPGAANLLVAGTYLLLFTAPTLQLTLVYAGITTFLLGVTVGPASAAIQSTVTARMRGVAVALTMFISALFGQGMGPWLIGVGSDALAPAFGELSLQRVLMFSPIVFLIGAALYFSAARRYHDDRVD